LVPFSISCWIAVFATLCLVERNDVEREVRPKAIARTLVTLTKAGAAPRPPNTAWLDPPKTPESPPPLEDCISTTKISPKQTPT